MALATPTARLRRSARLETKPRIKSVPFPFLRLPPESRNQIYSLALTHHSVICVSDWSESPLPTCTPLTGVCRQISQECRPLYHALNKFDGKLYDPYDTGLRRWLRRTGSINCSVLRNLRIHSLSKTLESVSRLLEVEGIVFSKALVHVRAGVYDVGE
ncbi:hypothetical protein LTR60_002921 [Cryomyces antarcticus]|nr:hypothetical protein LTR60_002921 [Cryomyces antarcticus]